MGTKGRKNTRKKKKMQEQPNVVPKRKKGKGGK